MITWSLRSLYDYCVSNKTDTSIVDKVIECEHNETKSTEKIALENKFKEYLKDCFKKADVSAYTKVDLDNNERKLVLTLYCDQKFLECGAQEFKNNQAFRDLQVQINKLENKTEHEIYDLENKTEQEIYDKCLMNIFKK
ncbi:unnamed protein product [Oppiella nova]|uniref:Uncharacterized protein n=1 Tax=Oppiella nova TaxID=334625 RepID=A0A7R9MM49_9ACAR|nr:unnamed protein product [Oppiella nova]CAG2179947.1 unnamed protein product [Oppiella nova]